MPDKPYRDRPDSTPEAVAYRNEYRAKNYDRIELLLPAGMKADIDRQAKAAGLSRTQWILQAIEAYRKP